MCWKCEQVRNGTDDGSLLNRAEGAMQERMLTARIALCETNELAMAVCEHMPLSHKDRAYWEGIRDETARLNQAMKDTSQKMLDIVAFGMAQGDAPADSTQVN